MGHSAPKHKPPQPPRPSGISPEMEKAIQSQSLEGSLTCIAAMAVAGQRQSSPRQVGQAMDALGIRIKRCQLGLFGYPPPNSKPMRALDTISAELRQALTQAAEKEATPRLTCHQTWRIADQLGVPRMDVAGACEAMGIKIKPCQLGAF